MVMPREIYTPNAPVIRIEFENKAEEDYFYEWMNRPVSQDARRQLRAYISRAIKPKSE